MYVACLGGWETSKHLSINEQIKIVFIQSLIVLHYTHFMKIKSKIVQFRLVENSIALSI